MDYWEHQTDKPLYPDVVWSKPETKNGAGKLGIFGGSSGAMSLVASSYSAAENAGIGTIHLLVPNSLAKVTKGIPFIAYAASNPSGGFAKSALAEMLQIAGAVDGIFLAGDFGKNSETSLLLESFVTKYNGPLYISSEALSCFPAGLKALVHREQTVLFLDFVQLRELAIELKSDQAITSSTGNPKLAEILHSLGAPLAAALVVTKDDSVWFAYKGRVIDSPIGAYNQTKATVWALQQPEKMLEAMAVSCIV